MINWGDPFNDWAYLHDCIAYVICGGGLIYDMSVDHLLNRHCPQHGFSFFFRPTSFDVSYF